MEALSSDQIPPVELYVIKTIIIKFSYHFTFVLGRFMERTKGKKREKRRKRRKGEKGIRKKVEKEEKQ